MRKSIVWLVAFLVMGGGIAQAQTTNTPAQPESLEILGISVEGVDAPQMRSFIQQRSGLQPGESILIPGDQKLAEAIRNIYRLGTVSDVKILEERRVGNGVFLNIKVQEEPRLDEYSFSGLRKKGHRRDLRKDVPLLRGSPVRPADIERSRQVIIDYYKEKGHPTTTVDVVREEKSNNRVDLDFQVSVGPRVEIEELKITGAEAISSRKIRRKMKGTKQDAWWRLFKRATFDRAKFEEDIGKVIDMYNSQGYYDAHIARDTVYVRMKGDKPEMVVELDIHEGNRYHVRDIEWEGNTIYPDAVLSQRLGFQPGDVFNTNRLEQNLYQNAQNSDVSSLYMNRGYMAFRVNQTTRVVEGDSVDLHFDIFEGDVFNFGNIKIAGNAQTKDYVVRRELYTIPGQTFSRDFIQESIRRLMQLNYFTQESLAAGPGVDVNETDQTVDLTYNLEEGGASQLQLSGTWGRFGLVLQLGFQFNNFSSKDLFKKGAWRPIPSGDGQQLGINVQTNGRFYQQYSLSFTEPWFRGRPTPVGFSLSFSRLSGSTFVGSTSGTLTTTSARVFYQRRLKWPDDKFSTSSAIRYQFYDNNDWSSALPDDISQEVTFQQSLTRNSTDHPFFPTTGSKLNLSAEIAPPIGDFTQYLKTRFNTSWNIPLFAQGKVALGFSSDFGYVMSITGDPVQFERFIVGGSPFETSGTFTFFGSDIIYMRGYPAGALGPREPDGTPSGGQILNKYTSELRFTAVQSQQLSAAPYLFMDAGNAWAGGRSYNPSELYRSAGFGARLFLPILGMIELAYGRNFDEFEPVNSRHNGSKRWYFQFTIGQGFNQ